MQHSGSHLDNSFHEHWAHSSEKQLLRTLSKVGIRKSTQLTTEFDVYAWSILLLLFCFQVSIYQTNPELEKQFFVLLLGFSGTKDKVNQSDRQAWLLPSLENQVQTSP